MPTIDTAGSSTTPNYGTSPFEQFLAPTRTTPPTPRVADGDVHAASTWPGFCADCVRDVDPGAPTLFDNRLMGSLESAGLVDIDHKPLDPLTGTRPENASILGGLFDLGSPQEPGAGTAGTWWVPDRLFGFWDMSDFYLAHDQLFDRSRTLRDLPTILSSELDAFVAGMSKPSQFLDPVRWVFQGIYSAATTTAALGFATVNTLADIGDWMFG